MRALLLLFRALLWVLAGPSFHEPASEGVTFTEDVAPIIFENCTECHRPGQAAPFSLVDYESCRKRSRMIALVTESRLMPPWPPVEGHGAFVGARYLSADEVATLQAWAEQGAPEGDPARLPERPEFSDDWKLGPPDVILQMPRGFEVPADGPDLYRLFPIPAEFETDRWLLAMQVRPGPDGVVHHVRLGYDSTGETRRLDQLDDQPGFEAMDGATPAKFGLGAYVIGSPPFQWPADLVQRIPAGSDIVLNTHFHPVGKAAVERTTVGLYFAREPATRSVLRLSLPPNFGAHAGLDLPAGVKDFRLRDSFVVPVDAQVVVVMPHAHYLCREIRLDATLPDGERRSLLFIGNWRFEWQGAYKYEEAVDLPAGTLLESELVYDNSSGNPANPSDPPVHVRWGMESTDEMGTIGLALVSKRVADHAALEQAILAHGRASIRAAGGTGNEMIAARLRLYDEDQDGRLTSYEVPEAYADWFARIDRNRDQVVDESELRILE